jgi:hypothetical protein
MNSIDRRTVISGAAAAAAVGSVGISQDARAQADTDFAEFMALSEKLTGISRDKLAPKVDPIGVAPIYFRKAQADPAFDDLMTRWRNGKDASKLLDQRDGVRYLARNIIVAWYLGAWCDPADLRRYDSANRPDAPLPFTVINPTAYTQGWAWRAAQAHPMGCSELRFGYWAGQPFGLNDLAPGAS